MHNPVSVWDTSLPVMELPSTAPVGCDRCGARITLNSPMHLDSADASWGATAGSRPRGMRVCGRCYAAHTSIAARATLANAQQSRAWSVPQATSAGPLIMYPKPPLTVAVTSAPYQRAWPQASFVRALPAPSIDTEVRPFWCNWASCSFRAGKKSELAEHVREHWTAAPTEAPVASGVGADVQWVTIPDATSIATQSAPPVTSPPPAPTPSTSLPPKMIIHPFEHHASKRVPMEPVWVSSNAAAGYSAPRTMYVAHSAPSHPAQYVVVTTSAPSVVGVQPQPSAQWVLTSHPNASASSIAIREPPPVAMPPSSPPTPPWSAGMSAASSNTDARVSYSGPIRPDSVTNKVTDATLSLQLCVAPFAFIARRSPSDTNTNT